MVLFCIAVVSELVFSIFVYVFMLQNRKIWTERIYDISGGVAEQAVNLIKTVKCLRGEDFEVKKYERSLFEAIL
jgi:hypothetical protein